MQRREFLRCLFVAPLTVLFAGCGRSTYIYDCRDGTQSHNSSRQWARSGCDAHGGVVSETPRVVTSPSSRPGFRFGSRRSRRRRRR